MGPEKQLVDEVERGLTAAHPGLRKTVEVKLALLVGAMIEDRNAEHHGIGQPAAPGD